MPISSVGNISAQLEALDTLSNTELKLVWKEFFRAAPPHGVHRDYLVRAISHAIQEREYGSLPLQRRRLLLSAKDSVRKSGAQSAAARKVLTPGARILREWQGEIHEVIVLENGFMYRGTTFKSLSVIARTITNTRWSGPAFFGLKRKYLPQITQTDDLALEATHGL